MKYFHLKLKNIAFLLLFLKTIPVFNVITFIRNIRAILVGVVRGHVHSNINELMNMH